MDIKNNDFVTLEVDGLPKLAKVLDISINNMSPICTIYMIDDNSQTLVGAGILKKVNIFSLMKTNCPICGTPWVIKTEGVHDLKYCNKCNKDGDLICLKFRGDFLRSQKS